MKSPYKVLIIIGIIILAFALLLLIRNGEPSSLFAEANNDLIESLENEVFSNPCLAAEYNKTFTKPFKNGDFLNQSLSPENNSAFIEQLKNGDFSNVRRLNSTMLDEDKIASLERLYAIGKETDEFEWIECKLNTDGLKGLIWREKDDVFNLRGIKRIFVIFAFHDDEIRLVDSSFGRQTTNFFFLGENSNFILYFQSYGVTSTNIYTHYTFSADHSMELISGLKIEYVPNISELDEDWLKGNSNIVEGIYCTIFTEKDGVRYEEQLEKDEFLEAFKEMTGICFENIKPDWFTWRNIEWK